MRFLKYKLTSDRLCLGERTKGGRYKPSSKTLRYSQICGALKHRFGIKDVHAVGLLDKFKVEYLSYTLKDRSSDISKIPLRIEFLTDVAGIVYISEGSIPGNDERNFDMATGAMISKGFGDCKLVKIGNIDTATESVIEGLLNTRIPINAQDDEVLKRLIEEGTPSKFLSETFGIRKVLRPKLGYLFDPIYEHTGIYVLSLFEDSKIEGCKFLLKDGGA